MRKKARLLGLNNNAVDFDLNPDFVRWVLNKQL